MPEMADEPDSARAWFVAFAGFIINMISAGIYRAQGLMFVSFMETFNVHRRQASMPFSVRMAVRNLLAPIIGILGQKYGASCVIISGGLVGTVSAVSCFFAPDLAWITFLWGGLYGLATALITVLPQIVISQYFVKYRTTATGLSYSGGCIGSFVFPAILEYLLHTYGLHGTYFILAGIVLNVIPAAMIIQQPAWCRRVEKKVPNSEKINDKSVKEHASMNNLKGQSCERGVQVGSCLHDSYQKRKAFRRGTDSHLIERKRSYSVNGLTYQMNNLVRSTTVPSLSTLEMNYKTIASNPEHLFDIDLEYLKKNCDLLFNMMSMEIPNMEISYRAILLEVEQDDLWHPDKNEVIHEIESIYHHIEKSLEFDPISNKKVRANGLYIKKSLLSGNLTMSKKSESLRAVRKYFRTYRERGFRLGKIRSAPNISNIYNELARKDYVLSKLKQLCNCNEIRVISHLSLYNPKHVLRVLFQIRTLYRIYNDLEATNNCEYSEIDEPNDREDSDEGISIIHKGSLTKQTTVPDGDENNFQTHIKTALNLHTNAIFLLLVCTRTAFFLSFTPVVTIIVDFGMDRGLPEDDGKYIIAVLALGDLIGRISLGWITDRGYASLPRYMLVAMCALSLCTASIPLMYSRWSIFCSIAVFGLIQGSMFVRHPVLVVKYLSPQQHSIAMGCMDFTSGILCFIIPTYIGFFRDTLGTYDPIFYINGFIVFLSGIAWLFEPRMVKIREQPQKIP